MVSWATHSLVSLDWDRLGPYTGVQQAAPVIANRCLHRVSGGVDCAIRISAAAVALAMASFVVSPTGMPTLSSASSARLE